jgi:hypothetical protein
MLSILKSTALVAALGSTVLSAGCAMESHDRYSERGDGIVAVDFASVNYGYSDGYWDNGHRWHRWADNGQREHYRGYAGNHYNDWNHDRDGGDGWLAVDFQTVGFGYSDGYWDNGHRWHRWSSDADREHYRDYSGNHYSDWNHDRDGGDGWHDR